jgi:predicted dehydrogenase
MDRPKKNKSVLNWGLLSTARINRSLIPPIQESKRSRLAAVASRTPEKASEYAKEWKIPKAYGSYEELLNDPEIDIIYNPLPNSMHAEWSIRAADAGKHVLCEKPLAMTVQEVDAMMDAAKRNGVVITEAFMYRHQPGTHQVKKMVDDGEIGALRFLRGSFSFNLDRPNDVRWDPKLGGGSLWDIGCYPISYIRYIAGSEPVEAFGWQQEAGSGVDVTFVGQFRFPNDLFAQIDCSFAASYRTSIEVLGSSGSILVPLPFRTDPKEKIQLNRDGSVKQIRVKEGSIYAAEIEELVDAVLEGKQPHVSLSDSRGNVAAITALLESAKTGKPVIIR